MNGGSNIVGFWERGSGPSQQHEPEAAPAVTVGEAPQEEWHDAPAASSRLRPVFGWLAVVASAVWVLALLIMSRDGLAAMSPLALAQFGAAAATVPALAGIVWLLALRTSHAEAQRFGASARAMRDEAAALERMVATLGDAIDARRTALAEQVRLLSELGDVATQRLASIGRGLSEEIDQADVHARSLADAAYTAQAHLETLLSGLPRAQAETVALTGAIERAGLAAGEQAASLDAQVAALGSRGREAEAVAGGAAQKLAAHIQRMESTSETAGARLEAVTSAAAQAVDALLDRAATAIDESRKGVAAQGDAMLAMVGANQAALDQAARETAESLAERIAIIEMVTERIAARLNVQRDHADALFTTLDGGISSADERLTALHRAGDARVQQLAAAMSALGTSAEATTNAIEAGQSTASGAIATIEMLLTALDAAAREIDETLPEALERLDGRFAVSRRGIAATKPELLALVTAAESSHDAIEAIAGVVTEQRRTVDSLTATLLEALSGGRAKADAIGHALDEAADRATRLSDESAPRLLEALIRVRDTASAAADHARLAMAKVVPEAADALGAASAAALSRVLENNVNAHLAEVATAADAAVEATQRAVGRLDEKLLAVVAAMAKVEEAQVAQEEAGRENFARRASQLIETLNSAAIDLTRSFAPDVGDSAWTAYLKGDRSVFTRRAVRLLDGSEQRDVAKLYDGDAAFRDEVNRYIHDFEAMLRVVLAQGHGSAFGVTLLSSDVGKLYVALAQAIERLR